MTRSLHLARRQPTRVTEPLRTDFSAAARDVILQAFDTGADVNIYLRSVWDTHFTGQIIAIGPAHFELFHSGTEFGMRWTMSFDDVATCALLTRLTSDTGDTSAARRPGEPPAASRS